MGMKKYTKLKIFIDGASRGNPGQAACAVVLFNQNGEIVMEEGRYLGKCTNNFAEYNALILALSISHKISADNLEIFSDSELLVKQFNGEYKIKDKELLNLMLKIKKETSRFTSISLSYIPRKMNFHADKLVNKILNRAVVDENLKRRVSEKTSNIIQPELF